jgi:DNA-3-methyladenine glycosylase I
MGKFSGRPEGIPRRPGRAARARTLSVAPGTASSPARGRNTAAGERNRTIVEIIRCRWAGHEPARTYHDTEWGVPVHDDARLFELLTLEGAQAGLSWDTILRKRAGYRRVFRDFDPAIVARFGEADIEAAVRDPAIVRHRGKIRSTVTNAAAVLAVQREFGSFAAFLWAYVDGRPRVSRYGPDDVAPTTTELSDRISRDLRTRGFTFVGSTIVQSFLQAGGILDDHRSTCFRAATRPS